MADIDLAKLIEPFTYILDKTWFSFTSGSAMNHANDPTHTNRCEDLLELIIYARNHCEKHLPEIRKYEGIVAELMKYVHHEIDENSDTASLSQFNEATGRYADFVPVVVDLALGHSYYTARNKTGDEYYIMARCSKQTYKLSTVNKWKADYFAIFNAIMTVGKKDIAHVAGYLIMEKYRNCECSVDDYDDCTVPIETKSTIADVQKPDTQLDTAINVQKPYAFEIDSTNTITNTQYDDGKQVNAELVELQDNYRKLFSRVSSDYMFDEADKIARLVEVHGTYIAVKIDKNQLVFNVGRKYLYTQSPTDLSKFVIDDVKYITIKGDNRSFAYPGFLYNGIKYSISGLYYENMYAYITIGDNDLSMIHQDLVKLAYTIEDKVNKLPEIEFFKDAEIKINNHTIKITDGMNSITTYDELDEYNNLIPDKSNYVKSKTVIGNFNGEPHLFLKIGKQTHKITKINKYEATGYLYKSGYFN